MDDSSGRLDDMSDDEFLDATPPEPPPKRPRGRPRKHPAKVVEQTRREYIEPETDGEEEDEETSPLFTGQQVNERKMVKIRVLRNQYGEGTLGYIEDVEAGEDEIVQRWGGGTFMLHGLNEKSQIVVTRALKIAADPIPQTTEASIRMKRVLGSSFGFNGNNGATGGNGSTMSFQELLAFQREQENERRRAEEERREREKKDDDERDRRRRRDDEERDERRRKDAIDAETRQQQFMANMMTMLQHANAQAMGFIKEISAVKGGSEGGLLETVKTIALIKDTFAGDNSEENPDIATTLIKNLGPILNGAGNAIGGAIREIRTSGTTGRAGVSSAPQLSALNGLPSGSPLTEKIGTLAEKIAARGQDPEQVLSQVADGLLAAIDGQSAPQAQETEPHTSTRAQTPTPAPAPLFAEKPLLTAKRIRFTSHLKNSKR